MRNIHFYLGTGFSCEDYEEIVPFEDDATDEEIEEEFENWKNDKLDASWWEEN